MLDVGEIRARLLVSMHHGPGLDLGETPWIPSWLMGFLVAYLGLRSLHSLDLGYVESGRWP
jgi:hypothetical protein